MAREYKPVSCEPGYSPGHIQVVKHPEGWMVVDHDPVSDRFEIIDGPFDSRAEARSQVDLNRFFSALISGQSDPFLEMSRTCRNTKKRGCGVEHREK